jgi:DNA polymerase
MFVTALSSEEDLLRGSPLLNPTERELFNQILRALKLSRLEVYITSLLKCGAELPRPEEWATCQGYFHSELELVQPEIVVTLGYVASVILLGEQVRLGTWGQYQGLNVMPTVHPSDIISGGDAVKRTAWKHLREVIRRSGQTP